MGTNTARSTFYTVFTALGLIGVATPFLPFTFDVSPLDALREEFELVILGSPFFLAPLASAASMRLVLSGRSSKQERVIAYFLSGISACATLYITIFFLFDETPSTFEAWLAVVSTWVAIALGIALVVTAGRRGSPEMATVIAIQAAYVANASFCLILFREDWQSGAIITLLTVLVYVTQVMGVVPRKELRDPAR